MLRVVACDGARFALSVEMLSGLSGKFSMDSLDFSCFRGSRLLKSSRVNPVSFQWRQRWKSKESAI